MAILGMESPSAANTFMQNGAEGSDDGVLTGAFFGPSHEGAGGVLERDDLNADFGASR